MSQDKPSPVKNWMLLLAPIIGVLAGIIAYKNGMEEVAAKTLAIALWTALWWVLNQCRFQSHLYCHLHYFR